MRDGGPVPGLRDSQESRALALHEENQMLKRQANANEVKIKKMAARIVKLMNEAQKPDADAGTPSARRRRDSLRQSLENAELQNELLSLQKQNENLKRRLAVANAKYGSRATNDRRLPRTSAKKGSGHSLEGLSEETKAKLMSVVETLRERLADANEEIQRLKKGRADGSSFGLGSDIAMLQREIKEREVQVQVSRQKLARLDDLVTDAKDRAEKANRRADQLEQELRKYRNDYESLKSQHRVLETAREGERDLRVIIEDLQNENRRLEQELAEQIRTQSSTIPSESSREGERRLRQQLDEALNSLRALKTQTRNSDSSRVKAEERMRAMEEKLTAARRATARAEESAAEANERIRLLEDEKALLLKRLGPGGASVSAARNSSDGTATRLGRDETLEGSSTMNSRNLRNSGAASGQSRCSQCAEFEREIHELKEMNADLALELRQVQYLAGVEAGRLRTDAVKVCEQGRIDAQRTEAVQEQLRQSALMVSKRDAKIRRLEDSLRLNAPGDVDTGPRAFDEYPDDLRDDENLLRFSVYLVDMQSRACRSRNPNLFTAVDFFVHETQATPIVPGPKASYDFHVLYKIVVDDFFLDYAINEKMRVEVYESHGVDYDLLGTVQISARALLREGSRIAVDVVDRSGSVVGVASVALESLHDMEKPIRMFEEALRTNAKRRVYRAHSAVRSSYSLHASTEPSLPRAIARDLRITVVDCSNLLARPNVGIAPYVYYKLFDYAPYGTAVAKGTPNPVFRDSHVWYIELDEETRAALYQRPLEFSVFNDDDPDEEFSFGVAQVDLGMLELDRPLHRTLPLIDLHGKQNGSITVELLLSPHETYCVRDSVATLRPDASRQTQGDIVPLPSRDPLQTRGGTQPSGTIRHSSSSHSDHDEREELLPGEREDYALPEARSPRQLAQVGDQRSPAIAHAGLRYARANASNIDDDEHSD